MIPRLLYFCRFHNFWAAMFFFCLLFNFLFVNTGGLGGGAFWTVGVGNGNFFGGGKTKIGSRGRG